MRVDIGRVEEMKRITVAALVLDRDGRVLIMKPNFKDGWLLPGGSVERGEYPRDAWKRVIEDEIGLSLAPERLVCIDYRKADQESIILVFSTRPVSESEIAAMQVPTDDFSEFKLVTVDEAQNLLRERASRRLPHCLKALRDGTTAYVEEGGLSSVP